MIGGPGFAAAVFARDLFIIIGFVAVVLVIGFAAGWGAFEICRHIWGAAQ